MAYIPRDELQEMGFAHLGENVKISTRAALYECDKMSIGSNSRIDDFCLLSGRITIGRNVHIAAYSNVAGGVEGVEFADFSGLAYGCHILSQSDDYSGGSMTNPTVPERFKHETKQRVYIGRHVIVGTCSIVFPGVALAEGTSVGAHAVVTKSTEPWSIYIGSPARRIRERRRDLLRYEQEYLDEGSSQ